MLPPVVLVVDDEPLLLRLVTRMLEEAGHYRVIAATSALEALDLLAQLHPIPSLLLTDVRMTPVDGPSLAKLVRQAYPTLPFLFMSGFSPDLQLPGPFVRKPFTSEALLERIEQVLSAGPRPGLRSH
jgi:two-component system, cell cycle sensor histidine kinase and response regulator CckA